MFLLDITAADVLALAAGALMLSKAALWLVDASRRRPSRGGDWVRVTPAVRTPSPARPRELATHS